MTKCQKIARVVVGGAILAGLTIAAALLQGCNVTRTTTTESVCLHRGDSSTTITSKTIETYDAQKR